MGGNSNLDAVQATIVVLTCLFGPSMAAVIGPYAVIVLAAIGGASWSVGRRPAGERSLLNDGLFFVRLVITALMIAGGLAVWAERWTGPDTRQWTLPVIALAIGAVGDDWPSVARWFASVIRRWVLRKADGKDTTTEP